MSDDDFQSRPWPWNKLRSQFLASAARTDYRPLPPVQDAPAPTLTGYYDEGRCPRCIQRYPPSLFGYCVTCHEQDIIDQAASDRPYRPHIKEGEL